MFLHHAHDLVAIGFGETLERRLADDIAEVDVILAILGVAELVDEELDRPRRRTDEAETA